MDNDLVNINNHDYGKSKNTKALLYTIFIFSIIALGWFYTSPIFNKKSNFDKEAPSVSPEVSEKINSIGQSFQTIWSNIANK